MFINPFCETPYSLAKVGGWKNTMVKKLKSKTVKKKTSKRFVAPRKEKFFDLNIKEQANEYYNILTEVAKRKLKPAILAKGTM